VHCCRESETIIISADPTNEAKVQTVEVSGYLIRGMEVGVRGLLGKFEGIGCGKFGTDPYPLHFHVNYDRSNIEGRLSSCKLFKENT